MNQQSFMTAADTSLNRSSVDQMHASAIKDVSFGNASTKAAEETHERSSSSGQN